jgi:hypothetical protein
VQHDLDFPDNFIDILRINLEDEPDFEHVLRRPLRDTDPDRSVGIFPAMWAPTDFEIGQRDPAVAVYSIQIQTLAKNATEEEGIIAHTRLAKKIRVMLYRDDDLIVQCGRLKTERDSLTERTQRWGITSQNFLTNEIGGQFLYLAVTDVWLETETV